ncbi:MULTISPECIES: Crp/Fnr family transcriptional regulator [unclassified Sphingobium]|uniref:Crp/Fnr family transcriptional regulator n=2 Tax=unclassified Sphingobium TaxID=2611147 RepID=UPI002224E1FE|nr:MULTISPECIES: Crp/Fnr family transcriptional regulator [unclassified Sphingobium]MCW2351199.1 CRP-like cAMP-binding protein [Sphingobium sp. B12D2B]MCW2370419.1 CRP-like cAMP-binding protein [Sphingobium sp. B11D3D]MCW2393166.1 CRP-like cAMP-binding protein [Sphingobium sp. B11D3A]
MHRMHDIVSPGIDHNNLVAALNPADLALMAKVARVVRLPTGTTLYDPGDTVVAAYFPLGDAVATFHVLMDDGSSVEIAMVGREGAVGGIVSSGRLAAYSRSCVMHGGYFARFDSATLETLKASSPAIRDLLSRYADCLLAQIFQSVACNAVHSLEMRAAKWLTAAVDRTGNNQVMMTQEEFGSLLGIARSYASRLIKSFKTDGLVQTRRGSLVVLDADRLRQRACSCNDMVRTHFDHVLAGVYPDPAELEHLVHDVSP